MDDSGLCRVLASREPASGQELIASQEALIEAEVPHAELLRYATELRSMTQGRGSYSLEFDHYERVPENIVSEIAGGRARARAAV